ncbi:MAG: sensor domain-containing diguanylate cyclase [Pseudoxanthomonas sp.]
MIRPEKPDDELLRMASLHRYQILDTEDEKAYDDLVTIAAGICATPTAAMTLVDTDRQWFKSRVGLDVPETSRDLSFCGHTILTPDQVMIVPDATEDARFFDNPLVTAQEGIRFYAGAPLRAPDGHTLGALCVIDSKPRQLEPHQIEALQALSRQVINLMELRRVSRELQRQLGERDWYEQQLQLYQKELEQQNADLTEQTRTDPLTGLSNRRALAAALVSSLERGLKHNTRVSVAMIDVDHFKLINDLQGHAVGDEVLVNLAALLRAQFGGTGMVARYGGEEFVALLEDCDAEQARMQCEYLREAVAYLPGGVPLTISIGVTECRAADTPEGAFCRADEALYAAKRAGRDRVIVAP